LTRLVDQLQLILELVRASIDGIREGSWAVGGGAALELQWGHRFARDVDVFFYDPMLFAFFSPRVNDFYDRRAISAVEGVDNIVLVFEGTEINIVCAVPLTNSPLQAIQVDQHPVPLESPHEIIARKMRHRRDALTKSDLFDTAKYLSLSTPPLIAIQKQPRY
jgi:hypothetical protein